MHISKSICLILVAIVVVTTFAAPVLSAPNDRKVCEEFNFLANRQIHHELTPSEKARYEELRKLVIPPRPREANPLDNQGGPDAFGYLYVDNVAPDTATYDWIELRGDAQATWINDFASHDDAVVTNIPIGFTFPFYGQGYTELTVSTNGTLQLNSSDASYVNECLPSPGIGLMQTTIFVYWDDLHLDYGGMAGGVDVVGYRNFGTYTVFEYDSIGHCCSAGTSLKFEVILYNTGRIKLQYNNLVFGANPNSQTIGIQESSTGTALQYDCDSDGPQPLNGLAIWIFQPAGVPAPVTNLQGQSAGSNVMLTWLDPTTDTNGDPISIDNVQVWLGPAGSGELLATVNPGVETYTHVGAGDGFHTYNVRAFLDPYFGGPSSVTVLVGEFPWQPTDYEWVDISQTGTLLPLGLDEYSAAIDIGFEFSFFDQTFTQLWVGSHGFITFNDPGFSGPPYTETPIPDPMDPNNTVYTFWDDNSSSTIGAIYYYQDTVEGRFIVSWDGVGHYGSGEQYWFQVILNDDGSIAMNYQTIPINTSCSIGVEDGTGSTGLQVCFDGQGDFLPTDGTAIAFWGGPSGRIEGIVRAFTDNQPIEGIQVETMQVPTFAFTDATGFYSLRLDSGTYSIRFSGSGYCDTTFTNILVEDDQTTIRNATLRSPFAQFSVTSISMATWPGHNVSYDFEITNPSGQCVLDFSISDTSSWLSANPVSGSVAPNQSMLVSAIANVQGLIPGADYQSALVITHDALGSPTIIPVSLSISLTADQDPASLPTVYALHPNYPNPFNATTSLRFDLPQAGRVKLVVFNVMGQAVATVADGMYSAGHHSLSFDATDLPSGMYLVKLEAGSYHAIQKMLLLK